MRKHMTPLEWLRWRKTRLIRATICRWRGHKTTEVTDILGCCARCYGDIPQTAENRAIFLEAARQAGWEMNDDRPAKKPRAVDEG